MKNSPISTGRFTLSGELSDFEETPAWSQKRAEMTARFAASGGSLLETIALGYGQLTGLELTPMTGWSYVGGGHAAANSGDRWEIYEGMVGDAPPAESLADFLDRTGARDVGELGPGGELTAHLSNLGLSAEAAAAGARFCYGITTVCTELAVIFSVLTDADWTPPRGWAYRGGDWTVAAGAWRWALIPTSEEPLMDVHRRVLCGPMR